MTLYRFLSWNVNGLRAAEKKGLRDFLEKENFDVFCIQETKLNPETIPPFWKNLKKFTLYWNFAQKKGYSGVLCVCRKPPSNVSLGMGKPKHDQEGRLLTLEYDAFYLVNCYTPNSSRGLVRLDYRKEWDADFLEYCQKLLSQKPVIIAGDLNVAHKEIDLARPKSNYNKTAGFTQVEIDGFTRLLEAGWIDSFREFVSSGGHYTWWSYRSKAREKNIGWRIDYFLISRNLRPGLKTSQILAHVQGSDHCPIAMEIEIE
ncbi:MAG: exodeoxyribonuclease III [Planctomycetota bacterium]|nr:MAG: exodeoxyribonuclease III [Planctomycetota bacterium]